MACVAFVGGERQFGDTLSCPKNAVQKKIPSVLRFTPPQLPERRNHWVFHAR